MAARRQLLRARAPRRARGEQQGVVLPDHAGARCGGRHQIVEAFESLDLVVQVEADRHVGALGCARSVSIEGHCTARRFGVAAQ